MFSRLSAVSEMRLYQQEWRYARCHTTLAGLRYIQKEKKNKYTLGGENATNGG